METLGEIFAKSSKYLELSKLILDSFIKRDYINY